MQKFILSEKNIKMVEGMLRKFFNNPNCGYESFHNFDCGYKKIKPYAVINLGETLDRLEIETEFEAPFIRATFQEGSMAAVYHYGSTFIFKGNEVIIRKPWGYGNFKDIYEVYRLRKLNDTDRKEISEVRAFNAEMSDMMYREMEESCNCDTLKIECPKYNNECSLSRQLEMDRIGMDRCQYCEPGYTIAEIEEEMILSATPEQLHAMEDYSANQQNKAN